MAETMPETTSSKSTKSTEESNSPPESSPPSLHSQKSSLSALKNTDKEQSISSVNIPEPPPQHLQDGFPEHLLTKSPKSSKNPDFWSLPIPRVIIKLSYKPHTSISPPLLSATLTLPSNSSILSSPATTESPKLLQLSSGCWQEKS